MTNMSGNGSNLDFYVYESRLHIPPLMFSAAYLTHIDYGKSKGQKRKQSNRTTNITVILTNLENHHHNKKRTPYINQGLSKCLVGVSEGYINSGK